MTLVSSEMPCHPHLLVFCLQSPQDCPQILPSPLAPMPTGGSQTIPVHLANAAFFQVSGGQAQAGAGLGECSPRWGPLLWTHHSCFGFLTLSFPFCLRKPRSGYLELGEGEVDGEGQAKGIAGHQLPWPGPTGCRNAPLPLAELGPSLGGHCPCYTPPCPKAEL